MHSIKTLLGRSTRFEPVFKPGQSTAVAVENVPDIVARMAQSFYRADGTAETIEFGWQYSSSSTRDVLTTATFPIVVGLRDQRRDYDYLDHLINIIDHRNVSLAVHAASGDLGIYIDGHPPEDDPGILYCPSSLFVSDNAHLVRDRPLAAYLTREWQQELTHKVGKPIAAVSDSDTAAFVLGHANTRRVELYGGARDNSTGCQILPGSMTVDVLATVSAYYPTRAFIEPIFASNVFEDGAFTGDGHVHMELTARKMATAPNRYRDFLESAIKTFGSIGAANMLSLADAELAIKQHSIARHFGLRSSQFACREIFVLGDDRRIVGHSVLNFITLYRNKAAKQAFVAAFNAAHAAPGDADVRLAFYKVVKAATTELPIDQPMSPEHYS